jgi:prephenate dehydrogenase
MAEAARVPALTPPFERIAIIGFGLIGGSLGLAIKRRWPSSHVTAIDRNDVLSTAMRLRAADATGDDLAAIGHPGLVVLAAPARENIALLHRLPDHVAAGTLVTDVGSTKAAIVTAASALSGRIRFVGGHPLAGAAVGGIEAARADLFDGQPWMLVDGSGGMAAVAALERFVLGLGARPYRLGADEHDRLLAYLSHLPQLAATALMHVVGEHAGAAGLPLSGRGLRDTTRLASSPASVWRDIVETNPDHIAGALDELIAALQALKQRSPDGATRLEELFASASRWKDVLERS